MEALTRCICLGLIALMLTTSAWARDAQGNLDLIISPTEGRPLIQISDSSKCVVILREKAQLALVNENTTLKLSPEWKVINDNKVQATFSLSSRMPAGVYALRATRGDRVDQQDGTIVVLHHLPETVDLYIDDTPTLWLQLSDTVTVSVPLPAKGKTREYEQRYGALPFVLKVGNYGLIIFDGQDTREEQLGQLYPLRRALIAKTWTIAISTTPCDNLPFRTQLTLFDDDPIALLLTPKPMPEAYTQWIKTRFLPYPDKAKPIRFTPNRIEYPGEEP